VTLNSPGGLLGMRATHGKACTARTWRRRRSLGRGRPELGDDTGVPPVSGTGCGGGERLRRQSGRLGRKLKQLGRSGLRCYWAAARLERAARLAVVLGCAGRWAGWGKRVGV
jgi:hypothetical protein